MFWRRHAVHDDDLSAYVDGRLDAAARGRIEAHIESCSSCRQTVAELGELRSALRELPRATAPRSFALREADVRPATPEPAGPFVRAVPMLGGLTAVAVLAFFVLLGFDATVDLDEANDTSGGAARLAGQEESAPAAVNSIQDDATRDAEPPDDANAGAEAEPDSGNFLNGGEAYSTNDDTPQPLPGALTSGDEEPADGEVAGDAATDELQPATPTTDDRDGWPAIRVAEAAAAGVALAAGASLAFVWRRRRT